MTEMTYYMPDGATILSARMLVTTGTYKQPEDTFTKVMVCYTEGVNVHAVYEPTGKGPFRGKDNQPAWEYRYVGVIVQGVTQEAVQALNDYEFVEVKHG